MKIEFIYSKEDLKNIIKEYVEKQYKVTDTKVTIICKKELRGYRNEYYEAVFSLCVKTNIDIDGVKRLSSMLLNEEDVKNMITQTLNQNGVNVKNLTFDMGIENVTTGYYLSENTQPEVYFRGVKVEVEKELVLSKSK